jgi:F420-dependent oxidoreductase-like protein
VLAEAEALGYDSFWTAESYGSDVLSPLAWWGSRTSRIKLGASVFQISARAPTATAMAAMTMDLLSDGRFILGLGVSGPQVVEGWYGQPFAKPLARAREYIEIVRQTIAREQPVEFHGEHYELPLPGGTGFGKPIRSMLKPRRKDLPIYLGAEGPKNIALCAELCDGWLPWYYSPHHAHIYRDALDEGFGRPGARRTKDDFEVAATVQVSIDDDLERAADKLRPSVVLHLGAMGAKGANFHFDVLVRMGWEAEATKIRDLFLEGKPKEAAVAVPTKMVEELALIGSIDKIKHELDELWRPSVVTTILLHATERELIRPMAELVL